MAVFLAVALGVGWFVSYYYESPAIFYLAIILALGMNFFSYWHADSVALRLSRAVPLERADQPELFRLVENLAITAGLPMPRLYLVNDPAPNAFATGRDKEHAAVAVTTGLLGMMDKNELQGVLAHELSHIGNRDILLSTVVVVLVGFIAILANVFTRSLWWGGGRNRNNNREGEAGTLIMIVGLVLVVLSPIIATLIQLAISRRRESLADADGALLTRYPEGLASALEKIEHYEKPMQTANNATAHLWIANPFGPAGARGLARLFLTHPPTAERVAALRGMEGGATGTIE